MVNVKLGDADNAPFLIYRDQAFTYEQLYRLIAALPNPSAHSTVALIGDYSPLVIADLIKNIQSQCVVVPLTHVNYEFFNIAAVDRLSANTFINWTRPRKEVPTLYKELHKRNHAGLVLFSSGSSGKPKAAVHDFVSLLKKFDTPRPAYRTIPALSFDHIGGINTLFYTLANGGCLVVPQDRQAVTICKAIEKHRVELLPTSPTFLNMLLLSEVYKQHDLSSLKMITYGTEPMPETTLQKLTEVFPAVKLQQTYGLSELGILRAKSEASNSLWVKIGGEGYETRIVDNVLQIRAESAMLGYLNAPSPFTEDGWFVTGDIVDVREEYVRFLGRTTDVINVGGEKVYPAQIEAILETHPSVAEAACFGEKHSIVGQVVCAKIRKNKNAVVSDEMLTKDLKSFCRERLAKWQCPIRYIFSIENLHTERFKKVRRA